MKVQRKDNEKSVLLQTIGDTPRNRIIDFLIDNLRLDYSKVQIARGAEISRQTLDNVFPMLLKTKLIIPMRKFGRSQLYTLNLENAYVKELLELDKKLADVAGAKEEKK